MTERAPASSGESAPAKLSGRDPLIGLETIAHTSGARRKEALQDFFIGGTPEDRASAGAVLAAQGADALPFLFRCVEHDSHAVRQAAGEALLSMFEQRPELRSPIFDTYEALIDKCAVEQSAILFDAVRFWSAMLSQGEGEKQEQGGRCPVPAGD